MKSRLIILLLSLVLIQTLKAQVKALEDTNKYMRNPLTYGTQIPRGWYTKLLRPPDTANADKPKFAGAIAIDSTHSKLMVWNGVQYVPQQVVNQYILSDSSVITQDTLAAGPFTSVPTEGFNPGTNLTPTQIIQAAFYRNQPATTSITGGVDLELMGAGTGLLYNLNWTAGRQSKTQPISTILVAGISQPFAQPGLNQSVSGTQSVNVVRNVNTTYNAVVTTSDNQVTTASTQFNFYSKNYFGYCTTTSPTDVEINTQNGYRSTTKINHDIILAAPTVPKYVFYAFPASFGTLSHFIMGGFETIQAVVPTTRNLQNGSGYVQPYIIYVTVNQQNTNLTIDAY